MRLNAGSINILYAGNLRKTHGETAQQIAARHGIPWISGKRQPRSVFVYINIYIYYIVYTCTFEGSFEVKLSTIWTDEKQRWEESEKRREEKRRDETRRDEKKKIKKRKYQKKEDPGARKGRKVAKRCVFPIFVAPEGRKVGSLKRRVRSQLARWGVKNCTPLWREAHLQVKS